jgi:hypothetical protein
VDVKERVCGEERDVEAAVECVDLVGGEWGTEENEDDGDDGGAKGDGKDEGEDTRLLRISQYRRRSSSRVARQLTTSFAPKPVSP